MKLRFVALMAVFLCTGAAWDAVLLPISSNPFPQLLRASAPPSKLCSKAKATKW